jgi:hypothetical protein
LAAYFARWIFMLPVMLIASGNVGFLASLAERNRAEEEAKEVRLKQLVRDDELYKEPLTLYERERGY